MQPPSTQPKPRVLFADDNPDIREILREHLDSLGYEWVEATNGDDALETFLTESPSLVLLDVMMPGLSGWEICRYIREREDHAHVGVIMLTGIGPAVNDATSPLFGADAHLDKPFDLEELTRLMEEVAARRSAEVSPG